MLSLQGAHIPYNYNYTPSLEFASQQIDPTMLAVFGAGLIIGALAASHLQNASKPTEAAPQPLKERLPEIVKSPLQFQISFNFTPLSPQRYQQLFVIHLPINREPFLFVDQQFPSLLPLVAY